MNNIRHIQELNKKELENGVSPNASWHADYRDTPYIYIGGLPFELSEGDIITIFSQFGEPTYVKLMRDKDTGKSRGFAFLKYEDQRSTDLAVDNLGGATVMGRMLRVDHTRYKKKEGEDEDEQNMLGVEDGEDRRKKRRRDESESENESESAEERPMIKEEKELAALVQEHDEQDPMKDFLIQEKKKEVSVALAKIENGNKKEKSRKHRHRHRHHQQKSEGSDDEDNYEAKRSRRRRRERNATDARSRNVERDRPRSRRDKDRHHSRSRSRERRLEDERMAGDGEYRQRRHERSPMNVRIAPHSSTDARERDRSNRYEGRSRKDESRDR